MILRLKLFCYIGDAISCWPRNCLLVGNPANIRWTFSEEPLLWMKWSLFSETRREILFWWKTKRKEIQVVNIFISQILHFAGKDNLRLKCNFWEYFRLGLGSFPAPCLSIFLVSFYLGYWVGQAVSFFQSWIFSDSSIFCPHSKIFNKPAWAMSI